MFLRVGFSDFGQTYAFFTHAKSVFSTVFRVKQVSPRSAVVSHIAHSTRKNVRNLMVVTPFLRLTAAKSFIKKTQSNLILFTNIPKYSTKNVYSQKIVVRPFYLAKMKNYESIYPSRGLGGASWGEITISPQSPTHTDSKEK